MTHLTAEEANRRLQAIEAILEAYGKPGDFTDKMPHLVLLRIGAVVRDNSQKEG